RGVAARTGVRSPSGPAVRVLTDRGRSRMETGGSLSELATPVIDADAHISEPPGTFVDHVPARFRDRVPYVGQNDEGKDVWLLDGEHFNQSGSSAQGAGWKDPLPSAPRGFAEMHPAAYDAEARLRYMDDVGLWAQVLYPNVAGFGAQKFLRLNDAELM